MIEKLNIQKVITGQVALPDNLYIGGNCSKLHGVKNKTLRYKKNKKCIGCLREEHKRNLEEVSHG